MICMDVPVPANSEPPIANFNDVDLLSYMILQGQNYVNLYIERRAALVTFRYYHFAYY